MIFYLQTQDNHDGPVDPGDVKKGNRTRYGRLRLAVDFALKGINLLVIFYHKENKKSDHYSPTDLRHYESLGGMPDVVEERWK